MHVRSFGSKGGGGGRWGEKAISLYMHDLLAVMEGGCGRWGKKATKRQLQLMQNRSRTVRITAWRGATVGRKQEMGERFFLGLCQCLGTCTRTGVVGSWHDKVNEGGVEGCCNKNTSKVATCAIEETDRARVRIAAWRGSAV